MARRVLVFFQYRQPHLKPARQMVENAGMDGAILVGKILEGKDYPFGYDAQNDECGDLFKLGIIDPTKVMRTALQHGGSVAGLLIRTEAMVAENQRRRRLRPPYRLAEWIIEPLSSL